MWEKNKKELPEDGKGAKEAIAPIHMN